MTSWLPEGHVDADADWYVESDPGGERRARAWPLVVGVAVAVALAAVVLVAGRSGSSPIGAYTKTPGVLVTVPAQQRVPGPMLRGELLDGSRFDLAAWQGQILVINTWGSWCPPCRAETPELVRVANATRSQGVRFLGIDVRDNRAAAKAFVRQYRVPYPSLFDPDSRVSLQFRGLPPNAIPTTVVYDRRGRIAARAIGRITEPQLTAVLRRLQAEPA